MSHLENCIGHTITTLELRDNVLHFEFSSGRKMKLSDRGQDCCESRYITTDDDPASLVGSKLLDVLIKSTLRSCSKDDAHDIAFVEVKTDRGSIVLETHNEHNGCYGGFDIECTRADD